jgi:hypothetical protein
MSVLKAATDCWRQAAKAENQAAQITDRHLRIVYLRIAKQWSTLARSYEFAESAEQFLLDAKRTKDANSRQHSGELVHLPSSLASHETEPLAKAPFRSLLWDSAAGAGGIACGARSRSRLDSDVRPEPGDGRAARSYAGYPRGERLAEVVR